MKLAWTWQVLLLLLVALVVGAATLDRSGWPSFLGDEATYLMQAESLAWDGDLLYERRDYERFVAHHGAVPEGLILQSGDGGATITYGKPFFYALYVAPFVRLAPVTGPYVANALLLLLAAVFVAETLRRRLGRAAPLWVAALIFATPTFAYVFWVHADLFLFCLAAIALALAADPFADQDSPRRAVVRFLLAGGLLAAIAFSRPMYAVLFLPAAAAGFTVAEGDSGGLRRRWLALLAGGLALLLAVILVHQSLSGSFTSYGASRRGFYGYTGFPAVDFPAESWAENLDDLGNHAWLDAADALDRPVSASLWGFNAVYFVAGRHVGLLPYFLPLLLAFAGRPRRLLSWAILAAAMLGAIAFFHLRPFNFWGGGAAIGNRYFLPLLPALWFLRERPLKVPSVLVVTALAGLFIAPLWLAPRAYPLMRGGETRYVSPVAEAILPFETTQSHLKPAGREDVVHHGLWIKFLDREVEALKDGERLRLKDGGGAMLIGRSTPLTVLELELGAGSETRLAVAGARLEELARRGPWRRFRLELDKPRAVHPMWWSWEPFYLYHLRLSVEETGGKPVAFVLQPTS